MSSFSRCWSSLFISIPTAPLKRDLDGIRPSPMNHFHHTSTVVLLLRSSALSATIPTIEFDKMQPFQRAGPGQAVVSMASFYNLPLKLLFAQPSIQYRQPKLRWRQMLWMTDSPGEQRKGKTKWGSDCWQEKHNIADSVRNLWLFCFLFFDSFLIDHIHKTILIVLRSLNLQCI